MHTVEGALSPVPLEVAAEGVPGVGRAAAVGVGPLGVQQLVIVVERPGATEGQAPTDVTSAVRAQLAPQAVAAVWSLRALPVDIRHNAKVDRTALASRMGRALSGDHR